jgi:hypothetical protein
MMEGTMKKVNYNNVGIMHRKVKVRSAQAQQQVGIGLVSCMACHAA